MAAALIFIPVVVVSQVSNKTSRNEIVNQEQVFFSSSRVPKKSSAVSQNRERGENAEEKEEKEKGVRL